MRFYCSKKNGIIQKTSFWRQSLQEEGEHLQRFREEKWDQRVCKRKEGIVSSSDNSNKHIAVSKKWSGHHSRYLTDHQIWEQARNTASALCTLREQLPKSKVFFCLYLAQQMKMQIIQKVILWLGSSCQID